MRDVFISYSEEDGTFARALAEELRKQGQSPWMYEADGIAGISYLQQINEAIERCRTFVLLASATSVRAHQVIREVEQAHEREKLIVPVRLGLSHAQMIAANAILRMAIGTTVTISGREDNVEDVARRIVSAMTFSKTRESAVEQGSSSARADHSTTADAVHEPTTPIGNMRQQDAPAHPRSWIVWHGMREHRNVAAVVALAVTVLIALLLNSRPADEESPPGASALPAEPGVRPTPQPSAAEPPATTAPNQYTATILVPPNINIGVSAPRQTTLISLLGEPCTATESCGSPSPALAQLMVFEDVGPFRVRGLGPAVDAVRQVFREVQRDAPEVYSLIKPATGGMLCCRLVRGSLSSLSNHSWGTAIDLIIGDEYDLRGDGRTQVGLSLLAPFFNKAGFFWGAGFGTEDSGHFEVGDGLLRKWQADGLLSKKK